MKELDLLTKIDSKIFAKKTLEDKWSYISRGMSHIQSYDKDYHLRRRFNPHHPPEQVADERRTMQISQYTKLCCIKDLYAEFRDELSDTCGNERYSEARSILERLFTQDVDIALRNVIEE